MGSQGATRSFPTTSWWIPVFLRWHLFFIGLREHFQETVVFTRVYASWSTSWYKKTCSNGVLVRKKCKWTHFYVANLNEHIFFWDLFQTCLSISYLLNHIGLVSSICPHMSSNLHVYHAELFILPGRKNVAHFHFCVYPTRVQVIWSLSGFPCRYSPSYSSRSFLLQTRWVLIVLSTSSYLLLNFAELRWSHVNFSFC